MKVRRLVYMLLVIMLPALSLAQEKNFDEKKWKKVTTGIDYSGDVMEDKKEDSEPQFDPSAWKTAGSIFRNLGPVFKVIMVTLFIVVLVYIISKLVGGDMKLRKKKLAGDIESLDLDALEENLMDSDLMDWLNKAVEAKNYKLALRIYYLMIIQQLAENNIIKWKKEKTNLEYLYEMRDSSRYSLFEEITNIYQYVWYGDKQFSDPYLIKASHRFKDFYQSIYKKPANE